MWEIISAPGYFYTFSGVSFYDKKQEHWVIVHEVFYTLTISFFNLNVLLTMFVLHNKFITAMALFFMFMFAHWKNNIYLFSSYFKVFLSIMFGAPIFNIYMIFVAWYMN